MKTVTLRTGKGEHLTFHQVWVRACLGLCARDWARIESAAGVVSGAARAAGIEQTYKHRSLSFSG